MSASPSIVSTQHTSYSSTSSAVPNSRTAATRLDDAILQLRSLRRDNDTGKSFQTHVSTPTKGPVLSPRSFTSMNSQVVYPGNPPLDTHQLNGIDSHNMSYTRSVSASSTPNGDVKTSPATRKPSIPAQLRRTSNPFSQSSTSKLSPVGSHSSSGGYSDAGSDVKSSVIFDAQGRCTCCPFGYHVDIDFVNFSQDVQSPTASVTHPTQKSRMSLDSQPSSQNHHGMSPSSGLFLDDHGGSPKPVNVEVTQSAPRAFRNPPVPDDSTESPVTPAHTEYYYRSHPEGQLSKSGSTDTVDSVGLYASQLRMTSKRSVTSTQLAETMATHLPDHARRVAARTGGTALTISPESVEQIKKHMAFSLQRMQELEEQIKVIPLMQERISRLKMDKIGLAEQLSRNSNVSSMRSIGVGNFDIDEEMTKIEKVIQTVVKEPLPKPSASVGVGNYDVNTEYFTEEQAFYTLAEKVQRIKEKEIQTWIQEAETAYADKKAAMRSCGVGNGDVFAEPEIEKVKETEIKTVYIEPEKPEQRNVGLQAKPSMRDVCIEYSQLEEKPSTRTCGFNVDVNDLMMEMQTQNEEMERTDFGELQQGGPMKGWQMQKHVIQRKFMEAMHKGTQKDLVLFITSLLKRSVRSVGTTVKPVTVDFGMRTSSSGLRGTDVGVGDDTVNVTVRPAVKTRESFCMAKPVTRTQPTWTDLVLTCDSATNTQLSSTIERPPPLPYFSTTLEIRPVQQYLLVKEIYTGRQDQHSNSKARELRGSSSTNESSPMSYTSTKTIINKSSVGGPIQSSARSALMEGDSNSQSTTSFDSSVSSSQNKNYLKIEEKDREEHVSVDTKWQRSQKESVTGEGRSASNEVVNDGRGKASSKKQTAHSARTNLGSNNTSSEHTRVTTSQSNRSVSEIKSGDTTRDYANELMFPSSSVTSTTVSRGFERTRSPNEDRPEWLTEQRKQGSKDHEISSAPGIYKEKTTHFTTQKGTDGLSEMKVGSEEHSTVTTRSFMTGDEEGVLGSNFQKRKQEMMKQLEDRAQKFSSSPAQFGSSLSADSSTVQSMDSFENNDSSGRHTLHSAGDTFRSAGDTFSSAGDTFSSAGDTFCSAGDTFSSRGDTSSFTGYAFGSTGVTSSLAGNTSNSRGDSFGSKSSAFSYDDNAFNTGGITVDSHVSASSSGRSMLSSGGSTFNNGGGSFGPSGNTIYAGNLRSDLEGLSSKTVEERMELANSSGVSASPSGVATSVSRYETSESDEHGNYSQVIEKKESADGSRKEVVTEQTFSTFSSDGGRLQTQFPNFSDYFARGQPPTGRSERMQAYENSSYQSRTSAEEERNKVEFAGDPFISRHIEGQVSPQLSVQKESLESKEGSEARSPRSIMRKDSGSQSYSRSISFAEEAEVAQVVEEAVLEKSLLKKETEGFSDEDESEVSFDEGTYDGKHGNVSYHCEPEKIISKARSQEEIDIDVELQAACSIVQQHIEKGDSAPNSKMTSALSVIQQDWFKVASGQQASVREVDGYIACFDDFSTELLEHVINMADGNGNTVLHYAVSHCNFPIVSLIVESGVADVNLQNKAGYTPIMLAALSEVNSDSDRSIIRQLLSKGNVNLAASQAGQTALMLAVSHGRLEMVQLLLEVGADINLQDEDGSTALMCATEHGHTDIVKALLTHSDLDLHLKDNDGSTALEIALENSQKEIGMLLYAKDQANKANSTTVIKRRTTRIPGSSSKGSQKSSSREVTVTRRRY